MVYLNRYKTKFLFNLLTATWLTYMQGSSNMTCITNIVAVAATVWCIGAEGKMIRTNAVPALVYYLLITALIGTMIYAGFNPFPVW